jgi:hypothetical protein
MSVSAASEEPEPIKPKRIMRPLTEVQWRQARIQFETGDLGMTLTKVAAIFNTSLSSVQKRSSSEKWSKGAKFIGDARNLLQAATDNAMAKAADAAANQIATRITKELQPWIEKEKKSHIKRALRRSKLGLKRLDRVAEGYQVYDAKAGRLVDLDTNPKDEMNIAQAEEKYDSIIRRNLGMNEGSGLGGSLSIQVLTNQAAVQVSQK